MGDFTVGDIRIEGLQRISEGTVYNYLPVNIGDRMDQRSACDESLRALYATGFFRDVELRRDGGTLLVVVHERPSIESFTIKGNKDIKTEDLREVAAQRRPRQGQDLQPVHARRSRRVSSPTSTTRAASTACSVDTKVDGPAEQPGQHRDRHQGRQALEDPARSTSSATQAFTEDELREQLQAADAELAVLVPAGRPLLARGALGRHREAALVLPRPRLRRTSTSSRRRWRSRPTRTTSSSR